MSSGRCQLLTSDDNNWDELFACALRAGVAHDVYHSAEYHRSPQLGREGKPFLFSFQEGALSFLWPYLLTPIPLHGSDGRSYYDVTSVYGYAGPVASPDPEFIRRAWGALRETWETQGAVSVFTRFHPILGNAALSQHFRHCASEELGGTCPDGSKPSGATISIDLTLDSTEQVKRYQKVLRQEIRKSREIGFTTFLDEDWQHSGDFLRLYRQTMLRCEGKDEYLIDAAWLARFRDNLGQHARLFVTHYNGVVAATLLAMEYGPFLHAHLTGINTDLVVYSPLKVLLDDVREWGTRRGLQSFHLGGGLGGQQDSLFQFKRRFSPLVHDFRIGRWILRPTEYSVLEQEQRKVLQGQGLDMGDCGFFPAYRYQPASAVNIGTPEPVTSR